MKYDTAQAQVFPPLFSVLWSLKNKSRAALYVLEFFFQWDSFSFHGISGPFSGRSCVIGEVWCSMDEEYFGFFGVLSFGAVAKSEGL